MRKGDGRRRRIRGRTIPEGIAGLGLTISKHLPKLYVIVAFPPLLSSSNKTIFSNKTKMCFDFKYHPPLDPN